MHRFVRKTRTSARRQRRTAARRRLLPTWAVAAALAVGLAACPAIGGALFPSAGPAVSPPPATVPPAAPPDSGASGHRALGHRFRLPPTCVGPDGAFDHDAIVESQKGRLAVLNEELSMKLRLVETPHFLIFSGLDAQTTDTYKKLCELLYDSLCDQFLIMRKDRVWDGKCILVLLRSKSALQKFSDGVEGRQIATGTHSKTEAYFVWERADPIDKKPQAVHIVLCIEGHSARTMRQLFVHEGTHAFVAMFRRGEPLPRWLDEGLAMYMSVVNDPPMAPILRQLFLDKSPPDSEHILFSGKSYYLTTDEYPAAYTMVDYLCKLGAPQDLRSFMIQLKEGKDEDAAMQAVYNIDRAKFAKQWRNHVASFKPAK